MDPESGRDATKEDLLAWLQANWSASSTEAETVAGSSEEDLELGAGGAHELRLGRGSTRGVWGF